MTSGDHMSHVHNGSQRSTSDICIASSEGNLVVAMVSESGSLGPCPPPTSCFKGHWASRPVQHGDHAKHHGTPTPKDHLLLEGPVLRCESRGTELVSKEISWNSWMMNVLFQTEIAEPQASMKLCSVMGACPISIHSHPDDIYFGICTDTAYA